MEGLEAIREQFGEEYPGVTVVEGVRIPLENETRFHRFYFSDECEYGANISRLDDGSASISVEQLRKEWCDWSNDGRLDFSACRV